MQLDRLQTTGTYPFHLCSQRATTAPFCLSLAARRRQQRLAGLLRHRSRRRRALRRIQESLQRPPASLRPRMPLRRQRLSRLQPRKVGAIALAVHLSAGYICCVQYRQIKALWPPQLLTRRHAARAVQLVVGCTQRPAAGCTSVHFPVTKAWPTEYGLSLTAGAAEESDQPVAASNGTGSTASMPSSMKELHDLKVDACAASQRPMRKLGPGVGCGACCCWYTVASRAARCRSPCRQQAEPLIDTSQ